ncbi:NAD(P)/FAD-dependent oxidoreductase [Puerhibacterium puerhi]|uniref:NAD(P)/FAD-dependent oxidoreductase n=1 Tax=Puerhibacterium puerhi TaxID=2692623 RepID=UPI001356A67C|nr:FAD-dependent oxidoreductase [Puerhibacterium puerhi]
MSGVVVVGGGLAAGTAVTVLRENGYAGPVVLVAAEDHLPYERPPLSKGYLLGDDPIDVVYLHDRAWYAEHGVELRLGEPATAVDRAAGVVRTAAGELPYDRLVLATGAVPRRLRVADESGRPVSYLRTIEDARRLRAALAGAPRVAIVGGGWIGLEVAAAARAAGAQVTVHEAAALPLLAVLGPEVARVFADVHRAHGVDLRLGSAVSPADLRGADHVVVGVGAVPQTALAAAAGLPVDDGVLVDAHLRTADPAVFAIGDVANVDHPVLGRRVRVEHWQTAIDHGTAVGRTLAGDATAMTAQPYFYTDQYDLGMEYVGSPGLAGYDRVVVRGDTREPRFTAFWLRAGTVVAGMHVNDWDAIDPIRALVGQAVDAERLADAGAELGALADEVAAG